jgi:hypothetical protein
MSLWKDLERHQQVHIALLRLVQRGIRNNTISVDDNLADRILNEYETEQDALMDRLFPLVKRSAQWEDKSILPNEPIPALHPAEPADAPVDDDPWNEWAERRAGQV